MAAEAAVEVEALLLPFLVVGAVVEEVEEVRRRLHPRPAVEAEGEVEEAVQGLLEGHREVSEMPPDQLGHVVLKETMPHHF